MNKINKMQQNTSLFHYVFTLQQINNSIVQQKTLHISIFVLK